MSTEPPRWPGNLPPEVRWRVKFDLSAGVLGIIAAAALIVYLIVE